METGAFGPGRSRVAERAQLVIASGIGLLLLAVTIRGMFTVPDDQSSSGIWRYRGAFYSGICVSVMLSAVAIAGGTAIGLVVAILRRPETKNRLVLILRPLLAVYIYSFLAIPAYTLILFAYYWRAVSSWSAFWIAASALAVNLSPFAAQIFSAGFSNIPQAQVESARAFGYRGFQLYFNFHLRSILNSVGRPLLVQYYSTMKLSSLAAVIGVGELMHNGQTVIRETYQTMSVYGLIALGYILLVSPFALLSDYLQRRNFRR